MLYIQRDCTANETAPQTVGHTGPGAYLRRKRVAVRDIGGAGLYLDHRDSCGLGAPLPCLVRLRGFDQRVRRHHVFNLAFLEAAVGLY